MVKTGGYVMDMWAQSGVPCLVRDEANIPPFFVADMRRSKEGDLRIEDVDIPSGVEFNVGKYKDRVKGNFLVARARRVRG